jgi:phosphoribosylformylglycinamidine synthase
VRLGIIPALGGSYGRQEVTLAPNHAGYFIDRWIDLMVEPGGGCVFTKGLTRLRLPVRHGEGRLLAADEGVLRRIEEDGHVALRYCNGSGMPTQEFPANPNGSQHAIAGISDKTGRVFGLMPHPEAALSIYQYPDWTCMMDSARRSNRDLTTQGDGYGIFQRAYEHAAGS